MVVAENSTVSARWAEMLQYLEARRARERKVVTGRAG